MTKRFALLAVAALIVVLGAAPDAMANHCFRCKWVAFEQEFDCVPVSGSTVGRPICETDGITCQTSGNQCAPHTAGVTPLASEYTVASVERLDEPSSGATEAQTQVAELDKH
jgi:hypothetical protein